MSNKTWKEMVDDLRRKETAISILMYTTGASRDEVVHDMDIVSIARIIKDCERDYK